jgi:3'-phosphoadenosine 5'-phosphosulfate sulfotransferase (PAPS reductase)/FAD synthetase
MAAAALDRFTKRAMHEIKKLCKDYDGVYVMFSGGRDSLVTLDLVLKTLKNSIVNPLFIDTGIATPGLKDYVIKICESYGLKPRIIGPNYDFFELVIKKGFPMVKYRWCKEYLKMRPLKRFVEEMKEREKVILVTGVRKEESWFKAKASKVYDHPFLGVKVYAPIFNWTSKLVKKYIEANGLEENPLYNVYGKAYDCWCTVYKSPADFALLAVHEPEFFRKFVDIESKLKRGGSALYYKGERVYLRDIGERPQIYLEKYPQKFNCPLCRSLI